MVVQLAVCGANDPPEMNKYDKLRERTIRVRDKSMKKDTRDNSPGVKKKAAEEETVGRRKRKKVEP